MDNDFSEPAEQMNKTEDLRQDSWSWVCLPKHNSTGDLRCVAALNRVT